jgi:hypothetical protein
MELTLGLLRDELPDMGAFIRADAPPEMVIPLMKIETLFDIPHGAGRGGLRRRCAGIFASYAAWDRDMLMAVIQRRSIGDFLSIAARKLTNPLLVFDNGLRVQGLGGEFKKSVRGTLWENLAVPGLALNSFFTLAEMETTNKMLSQSAPPCLFRPEADKEPDYVVSGIRIGGRLYGFIGSVGINGPFTPGQLALVHHVGKILALFIENNDTLMKVAENKTSFMKYLLEGNEVAGEAVSHRLGLLGWNIRDDFFLLDAHCPVSFTEDVPVHSVPYLKLLNGYFSKSLICVYRDSIILVIRAADYPLEEPRERKKLEKFLAAEQMRCGVSALFKNFMDLRRAYTQSRFAADYCRSRPGMALCPYHECYEEHIMRSLEHTAELKCFCHPVILSLWESGDEDQRLLIRCLHTFLLNGGNLSLTAKSLYVHRNTLIYRLGKLSELLGENIKELDAARRFYYLLSCMIAVRFEG